MNGFTVSIRRSGLLNGYISILIVLITMHGLLAASISYSPGARWKPEYFLLLYTNIIYLNTSSEMVACGVSEDLRHGRSACVDPVG